MIDTRPLSIDRGVPLTAIDAAVAVGIAAAQKFAAPPAIGGNAQPNLFYSLIENGGVATTLTVDHEISFDFGASWKVKQAGIDLIAARVGKIEAVEGVINRLNIKTLALGTAASVSVQLTT
jgi:hypothetical protein